MTESPGHKAQAVFTYSEIRDLLRAHGHAVPDDAELEFLKQEDGETKPYNGVAWLSEEGDALVIRWWP